MHKLARQSHRFEAFTSTLEGPESLAERAAEKERVESPVPSSKVYADFARIGIAAPLLQRKPAISEAGDLLEQEADRVADAALSGRGPGELGQASGPRLQESPVAIPAAPPVDSPLAGEPSQALESEVRDFMEARMGYRFANIRIHNNPEAARTAEHLNARAFTMGQHIAFAEGEYAPGTSSGMHLIAHELAHVLQQSRAPQMEAVVQKQAKNNTDLEPFSKAARVKAPDGLRLRSLPAPNGPTKCIMPFDTPVQIYNSNNGWCFISVLHSPDEDNLIFVTGYCEDRFLESDPPEPGAHLHYIKEGETLDKIVKQYYAPEGGFQALDDPRPYVQAIWMVNQHKESVTLKEGSQTQSWWNEVALSEAKQQTQEIYQSVQIKQGQVLWIPSKGYIQKLRDSNQVGGTFLDKTGALGVAALANMNLPFLPNPTIMPTEQFAFAYGMLRGMCGAVWDLVMGLPDLAKMMYALIKSAITESDVRRAMNIALGLSTIWVNREKLCKALGESFASGWFHADPWERGKFQGETVGYALMTILLTLISSGTLAVAKGGTVLAKVVNIVKTLDKLSDPFEYSDFAKKAKKAFSGQQGRIKDFQLPDAVDVAQKINAQSDWGTVINIKWGPVYEELVREGLNLNKVAKTMSLGKGGNFRVFDCVKDNFLISIATGKTQTLQSKFKKLIGATEQGKWNRALNDLEKASTAYPEIALDRANPVPQFRLWIPPGNKNALIDALLKDSSLDEFRAKMSPSEFKELLNTLIEEKPVLSRIPSGTDWDPAALWNPAYKSP